MPRPRSNLALGAMGYAAALLGGLVAACGGAFESGTSAGTSGGATGAGGVVTTPTGAGGAATTTGSGGAATTTGSGGAATTTGSGGAGGSDTTTTTGAGGAGGASTTAIDAGGIDAGAIDAAAVDAAIVDAAVPFDGAIPEEDAAVIDDGGALGDCSKQQAAILEVITKLQACTPQSGGECPAIFDWPCCPFSSPSGNSDEALAYLQLKQAFLGAKCAWKCPAVQCKPLSHDCLPDNGGGACH